MALMEMTFRSQALGFDQSIEVFLPEPKDIGLKKLGKPYRENLPVLYLLHGHTDNHTAWLRRSNMERYLHHSDYNMICVCTSMRNFRYADMVYGYNYYTYMTEELPNMIESTFRASSKREDRFIVGLSMGGGGAMRIAMRNTDRYAAVASLSGSVTYPPTDQPLNDELYAIYGTRDPWAVKGTEEDAWYLVDKAVESGKPLPKIYVSCGTADSALEPNRQFHQHLNELGVEHTYYEEEGLGHEWAFWDSEGYKLVNEWLPVKRG
ncbi:MAG: esterase family protein [Clostridia bacterium]|nr:esterase family protein [Clostridia bacterium]